MSVISVAPSSAALKALWPRSAAFKAPSAAFKYTNINGAAASTERYASVCKKAPSVALQQVVPSAALST
eukprot:2548248-Pleurochrysis_carterae.AAC.1